MPRAGDSFFRELWSKRKLKYAGALEKIDQIDIDSAKLICACLHLKRSILIVLPDRQSHRLPLSFATGLVMHAVDHLKVHSNHSVVYFGASAEIKDYLSKTFIANERLSEIFRQTSIGRVTSHEDRIGGDLPSVVFSYSTHNAAAIIESYRPQWVFVDGGDGTKTDWIPSILQKASEMRLPMIAFVTNPLSNLTNLFLEKKWSIFSWSDTLFDSTVPTSTTIDPLIIKSRMSLSLASKYIKASFYLTRGNKLADSRFKRDALLCVIRFLRNLETLCVPLEFYEAESRYYWGTHSIESLHTAASKFTESIEQPDLRNNLDTALNQAVEIWEQYKVSKPALWSSLESLCVDPPRKGMPTLLVFQSNSSRQLFSLAMLALNNITEQDLMSLNVWIVSLKQLSLWHRDNVIEETDETQVSTIPKQLKDTFPEWYPILVGSPNHYNYPLYEQIFHHYEAANLILPQQSQLLIWHYKNLSSLLGNSLVHNLRTLEDLIPTQLVLENLHAGEAAEKRIILNKSIDLIIDDQGDDAENGFTDLFTLAPRIEELANLMDISNDLGDADSIIEADSNDDSFSALDGNDIFAEAAIVLTFLEGYDVAFSFSDKIQVIVEIAGKRKIQERSARSIREGDKVLYINGQRRQSLYDLIISRYHGHPSFAVHISLIEKWQEELSSGFKRSNLTTGELLIKMQEKGSYIQTEAAIRFWLWRQVMAPYDSRDLKRLAEIIDMPFVLKHYGRIDAAAKRLRGLHISLGQRVNSWLEHEAFSAGSQNFNAVVDRELGLDFSDFQEALMILTVNSISEEKGLFLISELGQLHRSG